MDVFGRIWVTGQINPAVNIVFDRSNQTRSLPLDLVAARLEKADHQVSGLAAAGDAKGGCRERSTKMNYREGVGGGLEGLITTC